MKTITDVLTTIDTSKMERKYVSTSEMFESEFDIYDYLEQPKDNQILTYCYYHRWICTDTEVGMRVWYLDDEPVCISWQPYRKADENFEWLSQDKFIEVRNYALSLKTEQDLDLCIVSDESISDVMESFSKIPHKKFEEYNIKQSLIRYPL